MQDLSSPTRNPCPPAVEAWSLHYWTAREICLLSFFLSSLSLCLIRTSFLTVETVDTHYMKGWDWSRITQGWLQDLLLKHSADFLRHTLSVGCYCGKLTIVRCSMMCPSPWPPAWGPRSLWWIQQPTWAGGRGEEVIQEHAAGSVSGQFGWRTHIITLGAEGGMDRTILGGS